MYRPSKLNEVIGQEDIKKSLEVCIRASNKLNRPCPHMLFEGPSGLGKTTFAKILATETGKNVMEINGATISEPSAVIKSLITANDGDVIFIDEIHALPRKVAELLYMPLEDNKLLIPSPKSKKQDAGAVTIPLSRFCFIGATTHIGLVPKPLVNRLKLQFNVDYYRDQDIEKILLLTASSNHIPITNSAAKNLSKRCKGIPRLANNYFEWVYNFAVGHDMSSISVDCVERACALYGVDKRGLDRNDAKYIEALENASEPLGLNTIASIINVPGETIEDQIEPFLMRIGMIEKTKRGRILKSEDTEFDAIKQALESISG